MMLLLGEEIEVEDMFPDYEDEDEEGSLMLTTKEAICALEVTSLLFVDSLFF